MDGVVTAVMKGRLYRRAARTGRGEGVASTILVREETEGGEGGAEGGNGGCVLREEGEGEYIMVVDGFVGRIGVLRRPESVVYCDHT